MRPHHVTLSEGIAPVLAIHCTLAHAGAWKGVARALAAEARVVAFDLPDHGRSPDRPSHMDQHRLATDWGLSLLEAPAHLVGHSYGASVALRMACEQPEKVLSLTLIETVFLAAAIRDEPERFRLHQVEMADYEAARIAGDDAAAARVFNRVWSGRDVWADLPQATRDYMTARIGFVQESAPMVIEDRAGLLESGLIERLAMPVCLVEGAHRLDVIAAVNDALARRIGHTERAVIPDAGHMAPMTHPRAVADVVRKAIAMSAR